MLYYTQGHVKVTSMHTLLLFLMICRDTAESRTSTIGDLGTMDHPLFRDSLHKAPN